MEKKRPVSVTVIAILNFVFGGLSLAAFLCVGCITGILAMVLSNMPANEPEMADLRFMMESLQRNVPYIVPYLVVIIAISLILNLILVISGFGLLKMRQWARSACIFVAIVTLVFQVGGFVHSIGFVNPGMPGFQKEFHEYNMKKLRVPGGGPPPPQANPIVSMLSSAVGSAVGAIYPIATLWIMFLPNVVAAFRNWDRDDESGGYRDEGDDHFEREKGYDY